MGLNNTLNVHCTSCSGSSFIEIRLCRIYPRVTVPRIRCLKCHAIFEILYKEPKSAEERRNINNVYPFRRLMHKHVTEEFVGDDLWA